MILFLTLLYVLIIALDVNASYDIKCKIQWERTFKRLQN